jgi:hypothetical protein
MDTTTKAIILAVLFAAVAFLVWTTAIDNMTKIVAFLVILAVSGFVARQ